MKKFVFVDTETTGLDPKNDKLVELTYAVENEKPVTLFFGVKKVPAFIDDLTKFSERKVYDEPEASKVDIHDFLKASDGNTMVAANPSFDKGFLEANLLFNFHYRMLDVQSYAMARLDLDYMPSMNEIASLLSELGYRGFTKPDHSSRNDVLFMREAFNVLRYM